uniref:Uncharacterized protein n=1 Tax=Glossina palpalis gambiensis TaxID=67801 RepID=A0A1B0BVX7_9MUSC
MIHNTSNQVFRRFQLGQENKKEEGAVGSCSAENFDRFLKRLDNILKMPNAETPNNTDWTCGNDIEGSNSSRNQQGSRADAVNPNQQLIDMLRQENEALLSCMQQIGNLKRKVRQSQTRDAEGTQNFRIAAATSVSN